MVSLTFILVLIALLLAIISLFIPDRRLLEAAVVLLAIVLLIGRVTLH